MANEFEGKTIAGKYRIDSAFHESELGSFYRGWHVLMDKPVIVKVLPTALAVDSRLVDRFISECKDEAHASHPNLLALMDFGTDPADLTYAVYETAEGESLRDLIDRDETLPFTSALSIGRQTASALAAAHAAGLIHGALSPDKLLVDHASEVPGVKVFDFGAEPVGRNYMADVRYLAPEQYDDVTAGDHRSDIYSLGTILYEMLAGDRPYEGRTAAALRERQASGPPPPLSVFREELPADFEPMILSALSLDPDHRYQEMKAFAEDLTTLSNSVSGEKTAPAAAAAGPRRNIWQTAFVVLAGMSILAAALIYGMSTKRTDPTTQLQADAGSLPVQPIGPATGAQEESLAKMPAMTDAEIMSMSNMEQPPGTLPGGDGYNPWANGVAPPPGAPPAQYVPPGGQYYTIDPNTGSQFMPPDGGVVLVPVPTNTNGAVKATPTPKGGLANAIPKGSPTPDATPKPLATPIKGDKPASGQPVATPKPGRGKPKVS
jgi:serine/threonine-protein kinase